MEICTTIRRLSSDYRQYNNAASAQIARFIEYNFQIRSIYIVKLKTHFAQSISIYITWNESRSHIVATDFRLRKRFSPPPHSPTIRFYYSKQILACTHCGLFGLHSVVAEFEIEFKLLRGRKLHIGDLPTEFERVRFVDATAMVCTRLVSICCSQSAEFLFPQPKNARAMHIGYLRSIAKWAYIYEPILFANKDQLTSSDIDKRYGP